MSKRLMDFLGNDDPNALLDLAVPRRRKMPIVRKSLLGKVKLEESPGIEQRELERDMAEHLRRKEARAE